jgi:hypothetical protein
MPWRRTRPSPGGQLWAVVDTVPSGSHAARAPGPLATALGACRTSSALLQHLKRQPTRAVPGLGHRTRRHRRRALTPVLCSSKQDDGVAPGRGWTSRTRGISRLSTSLPITGAGAASLSFLRRAARLGRRVRGRPLPDGKSAIVRRRVKNTRHPLMSANGEHPAQPGCSTYWPVSSGTLEGLCKALAARSDARVAHRQVATPG